MLSIAFILLVAQSAFAAPSVDVNFYQINDIPSVRDNGRLISSYMTDGAFEYIDGGDVPLYAQIIMQIINDLANRQDSKTQALALLQTIVTIGELANGIPGDACEAAAFVNAYAYAVSTGNSAGLRVALPNYGQRVAGYIDTIVQLVLDPNSVRYSSGPKGKCLGGGRSYQFEETWDAILDKANAYQIGFLNEEYCAAKRMYNALNIRSNNLAAAITATSTNQLIQLADLTKESFAQFLRAVTEGVNVAQAGANAKDAIVQVMPKIKY